jgi:hypothetical protein
MIGLVLFRAPDVATALHMFDAMAGARAVAYDNQRIQFFANADGWLVELIEAPEHRHVYIAEVPSAGVVSFGGHDVEQRQRL